MGDRGIEPVPSSESLPDTWEKTWAIHHISLLLPLLNQEKAANHLESLRKPPMGIECDSWRHPKKTTSPSLGQLSTAMLALGGVLIILDKIMFRRMRRDIKGLQKELHPKSCISLRDAINGLEDTTSEMKDNFRDIAMKLDNHIDWHSDR